MKSKIHQLCIFRPIRTNPPAIMRLVLACAVGLIAAACASPPPQQSESATGEAVGSVDWRTEDVSGDIPQERGAGKLVAVGDQLILFGGFKECFDKTKCDHTYYTDLHVFDTKTAKWEKRTPSGGMPGRRAFLGAAVYQKKQTALFYAGTYYRVDVATGKPYETEDTIKVYDDLWEYDPAANTFTQRQFANAGPGKRLGAEIVVKDDTMYSFGGYDENFKAYNDLWAYDLTTNTWKQLRKNEDPGSPSKRYIFRFELSESGEDAYIFGGNYREKITIQRNDLWKYNFATDKFTEIVSETSRNISGRTHGAAAAFDGQFIIALGDIPDGGCTTDQASEHQNPTDEVWSLPEGESTWRRVNIGSGPPPLKRLVYARAGDRLYVTHGFGYDCSQPDSEGAKYSLKTYSLPLARVKQALAP